LQPSNIRLHVYLHLLVVILGFTAILGKLITLPAVELVWYRMLIAAIVLMFVLKFNLVGGLRAADILKLLGIGLIVAAHWITFYHAIKISNISVTLGTFASTTLFTSFLEPILQNRRIRLLEVLIGIVTIGGLYIIFQFETRYVDGILVALISSFLAALFSVLNKNVADTYTPTQISFYQMAGGAVAITVFMLIVTQGEVQLVMTGMDAVWMFLLATVCTAFAFLAAVWLLKFLSAYTVVLAINLEPVYGILLAFFIFRETEQMTTGFYLGTLILLGAVFIYPILRKRLYRD
jgi:drug/metabolite transporter (DMT)-like permease